MVKVAHKGHRRSVFAPSWQGYGPCRPSRAVPMPLLTIGFKMAQQWHNPKHKRAPHTAVPVCANKGAWAGVHRMPCCVILGHRDGIPSAHGAGYFLWLACPRCCSKQSTVRRPFQECNITTLASGSMAPSTRSTQERHIGMPRPHACKSPARAQKQRCSKATIGATNVEKSIIGCCGSSQHDVLSLDK